MVKINQKVQVISFFVIILITAISSGSFSSVYASSDNHKNNNNDNHEKNNDHDDDDFCEELVDEFEDVNDVVNFDTATDEQIDALEELRKFLVFEFDCVDEFEGFEWT